MKPLATNWRLKVLVQAVLARTPGGIHLNDGLQRLNRRHSTAAIASRLTKQIEVISRLRKHIPLDGATVMEVGTGWIPLNAVLLSLAGARSVITYDHVRHCRLDLAKKTVNELALRAQVINQNISVGEAALRKRLDRLSTAPSIEAFFEHANIVYKAPADACESGLPDDSVDLVFSYAVLEHVPEEVSKSLTVETRRVLKPGGMAFHAIGLHDHYAGVDPTLSGVNFLQYPEWAWRLLVKNRISYHNRMREIDFLHLFRAEGAKIVDIRNEVRDEDVEALRAIKIDERFQKYSPQELAVTYSEILMVFSG